jgi:hypothetical protein
MQFASCHLKLQKYNIALIFLEQAEFTKTSSDPITSKQLKN